MMALPGAATMMAPPAMMALPGAATMMALPGAATMMAPPGGGTMMALPGAATMMAVTPAAATMMAVTLAVATMMVAALMMVAVTLVVATMMAPPGGATMMALPGAAAMMAPPGAATMMALPGAAMMMALPGAAMMMAAMMPMEMTEIPDKLKQLLKHKIRKMVTMTTAGARKEGGWEGVKVQPKMMIRCVFFHVYVCARSFKLKRNYAWVVSAIVCLLTYVLAPFFFRLVWRRFGRRRRQPLFGR